MVLIKTPGSEMKPFQPLLGFSWEQHSLDIMQDRALGNGHAGQQLVQLLVIPDHGQPDKGFITLTNPSNGKTPEDILT